MNICPGARANVNPLARFLHFPGGTRQGEIRMLWVAKWFATKRSSTYRLLAIGYRLFAQRQPNGPRTAARKRVFFYSLPIS
jgi:hypothetical protein